MRGLSWKKAPNPQRTLLKGYGNIALSRGILPAAKLWWIFAEDSRVCKHPLLILGQNPPEFSPRGKILSRDKGENRLTLKLRSFTDRTHG